MFRPLNGMKSGRKKIGKRKKSKKYKKYQLQAQYTLSPGIQGHKLE
jgi:hypothetical protein